MMWKYSGANTTRKLPLALNFEPSTDGKLANVIYLKKFKYAAVVIEDKDGAAIYGVWLDSVPVSKISELSGTYKMLVWDAKIDRSRLAGIRAHSYELPLSTAELEAFKCETEEGEKDAVQAVFSKWLGKKYPEHGLHVSKHGFDFNVAGELKTLFEGGRAPCVTCSDLKFVKHWKEFSGDYTNAEYVQDVSSRSQYLRSFLENCGNKFEATMFVNALKDAFFLDTILICDERLSVQYRGTIWQDYYEKHQNILIADVADTDRAERQVFIDSLQNGRVLSFTKDGNRIKAALMTEKKISYLCIHLGRIQEIATRLHCKEQEVLSALEELPHDKVEHMVIHSGRGRSVGDVVNVTDRFYYMDFASLSFWLKEAKVYLVQGLRSLSAARGVK